MRHRGCSRIRDSLQRLRFVRGVPLDRFHEIRDEVMATVEFDIDLTPGLLYQIVLPLMTVWSTASRGGKLTGIRLSPFHARIEFA